MFGCAPQEASSPMDRAQRICEMLQAAAGSLSPCLCSHTRPIRQTGTAGVILLRMGVVIVQLDVHLASRLARSTWAAETMGREFWIQAGGE